MEGREDLVDRGRGPDPEERRRLERRELPLHPRAGRLRRLAGPGHADVAVDQPVLVVDPRVLDVVVEVPEVCRVEDGHRDRLPGLAPLLVQELGHEVGVAVRRLGQTRPLAPAEALPVAAEDPELEPAGLGEPLQHGNVAPAVGRPLLGDDEDPPRPLRLGRQPADGRRLGVGEPERVVPAPHPAAPVPPRLAAARSLPGGGSRGWPRRRDTPRRSCPTRSAPG